MKKYFRTLTIAGSDSGGGAGIQADLKTFTMLNCYGMSVITALTAQNTLGVQAIYPLPADFVAIQLKSVLSDIGTDAVKIGMLHNSDIIDAVATELQKYKLIKLVLDPVIVAKDGSRLLQDAAIDNLKKKLFNQTLVLTPNLFETEILLQRSLQSRTDIEAAAKALAQQGPSAVLIKGGHFQRPSTSDDCLYIKDAQEHYWFSSPRITSKNTHGTGCTLSAAITAFLAQGDDLFSAVQKAKNYLYQSILEGSRYSLGAGIGPVKHFLEVKHEIKIT